MQMEMETSGVDGGVVSVIPMTGLPKALGYRVPSALLDAVEVGTLVRVPLRGRTELGVVESLAAPDDFPVHRMKLVLGVEQPWPVMGGELLQLGRWISRYYGAPLDRVLEVMIPAPVRRGMRVKKQKFLFAGRAPEAQEWAALRKRAPKQAALLEFVAAQIEGNGVSRSVVLQRLGVASSSLDGLIDKGFIEERHARVDREAYADDIGVAEQVGALAFTLTPEQEAAVDTFVRSLEVGGFSAHLLHGVTGSGKTEVYLRALLKALDLGGSAIFLVPEVALTPQTVGRLRARLESSGVRTVVWHSQLSDGERFDAWEALVTGTARVVVGARSAVFAPLKNVRLIIVDEEHEPAYKQDELPRYNGRDVALYRARLIGATAILGSATPALESLFNVQRGKLQLTRLRKRVDDRQLPLVHVVDMRRELRKGGEIGPGIFSRLLLDKLRDRLEKREQAMLFLNRRGFHSSMLCPECGHLAVCDHCDISLTYHRPEEILRCHLCGFEQPAPTACPKCRSAAIRWRGTGTQRIEELARKLLPHARIVRMDTDVMRKKNLFREVLRDFRAGKIDILVGTQMIAKGLDFPNVTLVGLTDADISMHIPDFRAAERTFQLLVQVAGRAGRGDLAGEVVVQTSRPWAPPIQFARQQDFDGFAEEELAARQEYRYPPFRHLVHHLFRGPNPEKVSFYAEHWAKQLGELCATVPGFEMLGPAEAPVARVMDHYRFQLWYFTLQVGALVRQIEALRKTFPFDRSVTETIDVDAVSLV